MYLELGRDDDDDYDDGVSSDKDCIWWKTCINSAKINRFKEQYHEEQYAIDWTLENLVILFFVKFWVTKTFS